MSSLLDHRRKYQPKIPPLLQNPSVVVCQKKGTYQPIQADLIPLFSHTYQQTSYELIQGSLKSNALKVGVVFSGGQAPGGHNVIAGLLDALEQIHEKSTLFGFLQGPSAIVSNQTKVLTKTDIDLYRNVGGFDLIGSGRTKIETPEQMANSLKTCKDLDLDGLVIIGGDDSNTNAALLAEYFSQNNAKTCVMGIPKTIDGDLQSKEIEISFGFDSACKTYAELIGNIAKDALSSKKYYHFIKLMGRSASHITLECALKVRPNLALISEEGKSLSEIILEIADLICQRSLKGKDYGIILIPEGLIEFIPEMKALIQDPQKHQSFMNTLPPEIQKQLLMDRDPHGNLILSQIATEVLLLSMVEEELKKRTSYQGKFSALTHSFGYEGRSCFPSNFDANYCYSLGKLAAIAVRDKINGVICAIQHLKEHPQKWGCMLVPIVQLIHKEMRGGKEKPVIRKTLVDLQKKPFQNFAKHRKQYKEEDAYLLPGPMQFFGPEELTDSVPIILDR